MRSELRIRPSPYHRRGQSNTTINSLSYRPSRDRFTVGEGDHAGIVTTVGSTSRGGAHTPAWKSEASKFSNPTVGGSNPPGRAYGTVR